MTLTPEVLSHLLTHGVCLHGLNPGLARDDDWQKRGTAWDMCPSFPFVSDPVNYTLGPDLCGTDW